MTKLQVKRIRELRNEIKGLKKENRTQRRVIKEELKENVLQPLKNKNKIKLKDLRKIKDARISALAKENNRYKGTVYCPPCTNCGSINVIRNGKRYAENKTVQRFRCLECNKKFIFSDALRMRNPIDKIEKALKLRKEGLSFAQIANKVKGVSRETIFRWDRMAKTNCVLRKEEMVK